MKTLKKITMTTVLLSSSLSFAGVKFSFNNEDLTKLIEIYSKAASQKFVVDPAVRGKSTITGADDVPVEEAFNLLSSALATNGFAISKQGDTMVVKSARNIQRDLVETTTETPALKPERIVTYIYTFKNIPAESVNRDLRILSSKDGEMSVYPRQNQIIITDWASNIQRVVQIFKQIDQPVDPKLMKMKEAYDKQAAEHEKPKKQMKAEVPKAQPNSSAD